MTDANATAADVGDLLSYRWSLVTLVPDLALSWRRLHDTNHSGLWVSSRWCPRSAPSSC